MFGGVTGGVVGTLNASGGTTTRRGTSSVGFAIPSNQVDRIVPTLT